jgi:hypothetical protein
MTLPHIRYRGALDHQETWALKSNEHQKGFILQRILQRGSAATMGIEQYA